MKWLVLLLLVVIALLIIVILTNVKIHIDYYHGKDNDHLTFMMKAWGGMIKYKKEIPVIKIDDDSPEVVLKEKTKMGPKEETTNAEENSFDKQDLVNSLNDTKALLEHVFGMHILIRKLLSKVKIKKFEWHTGVGIGDAASTAILCGAIWSVKGAILGLISNYMRLTVRPVLTVTPNFQQFASQIKLKCIFQIRVGHAIWTGMKLVKYWKGGMPKFKTKPLSVLSGNKTNSIS
ncbi:MAG: DUF2953 domain-containing protein [Bacillota bacterium]